MRVVGKNDQVSMPPNEKTNAFQSRFVSDCRARGVRVTAQRLAVFEALSRDDTHPSADSLYEELRETMPSLSLSTVYRILESLEKEGLIRRVSAADGIARYEGNLAPHQHLICRRCGRVTDHVDKSLSQLRLAGTIIDGFMAEALDIRIVGTCSKCRAAMGKTGGPSKKKNPL
jgi:Fur family peroxide stress response transcriptional regulator